MKFPIDEYIMQCHDISMTAKEPKKMTAAALKDSISNSLQCNFADVISIRCTSEKGWIKWPIFPVAEEVLINVLKQGPLYTNIERNLETMAVSNHFMNALTQWMVESSALVKPVEQFCKVHIEN